MTDQIPESPHPVDEPAPLLEAELVEAEVDAEPEVETDANDEVLDAELVEAEVVEPEPEVTTLDLGDAAPELPASTDFDVVATPEPAEPTVAGDFEFAGEPAADVPIAPTPDVPTAPAPMPPTGGSFLDLPPLPDLNYPAPTPPPASPYPPPAPSYPKAANYPQAEYAPYPADYGQQAAGQAYGHGAPAPQPAPAPVNPYGAPTGFAVSPYQQQGVPADLQSASMAHWGALVATMVSGGSLGFLVPLILMQTKGQNDPFVRANAVASLNFSLTVLIGMIASAVLAIIVIGIVGLIVIPIVALILQIMASMAASRGEVYQYPLSIRFVK